MGQAIGDFQSGCQTRRKTIELRDPKQFTDPTRHLIPIRARWILRLVDVKAFMALGPATATPIDAAKKTLTG